MTSDAVVRLVGIRKSHGAVTALDGLDLDVEQGEFLTLLGGSGCGKTSTLRIVSGFEEPTEGDVYIDGRRMNGVPAHKRNVNTVFQSYALFPHMTIGENVAYGLRFDGVAKPVRLKRAEEMLARVGLADRFSAKPTVLSGGQMQRVALARALIKQPQVLLLDEPLSALDAKLRKSLQLELKRTQRETGTTFVFVTHDQDEAMVMSDRIAVMESGSVMQIGTPAEIFSQPASLFVAEFVGASVRLEGTVVQSGRDALVVETANGERLSLDPPTGSMTTGQRVRIVVRPGTLEIALQPAGAANELTGVLDEILFLGESHKLILTLADGQRIDIDERHDRLPGGISDHVGRPVAIRVPVSAPVFANPARQ
ncbi:ABC transporter ATP-binding protein [Arvimicrobium flavum]|uniref:ABC transporter ATP-binding protein n=1 Tax=Arvimicrobium flavum TaxID=3393320 RepID=UPI00237AA24E|nr:ABC transporter ATP-binding protein [Mesorhizobium shangrilense]